MRQEYHVAKSMSKVIRVAFAAVFALGLAKADVIKIFDATDYGGSVSVSSTNPARLVITQDNSLAFEFIVQPPTPTAVFVSDNCPLGQIGCLHLNIGEYPINPDPNLDFESDIFSGGLSHVAPFKAYDVDLIFQSVFPCAGESGCNVREDEKVYTLDTVTWSDGTVDTINFQSTPEPTSLLLFGTLVLAGWKCARKTA